MKVFLIGLLGLLVLGVLFFIVLAILSQQKTNNLGLQSGQLRACLDAPNCVCSEHHRKDDAVHFIQPLSGKVETWKALKIRIMAQGGKLEVVKPHYLHATFSSSIFHYVDDVECRWDEAEGLIHIRSSSRVGHSDFGVNRQRVYILRKNL